MTNSQNKLQRVYLLLYVVVAGAVLAFGVPINFAMMSRTLNIEMVAMGDSPWNEQEGTLYLIIEALMIGWGLGILSCVAMLCHLFGKRVVSIVLCLAGGLLALLIVEQRQTGILPTHVYWFPQLWSWVLLVSGLFQIFLALANGLKNRH